MKNSITQKIIVIAIAFFTFFGFCLNMPAHATGEFSDTCKNIRVSEPDFFSNFKAILSAECKTREGQYVETSLELNSYITNNGEGNLVWDKEASSKLLNCFDLAASDDGLLNATCFNLSRKNSNDVATAINLNAHIANIDGKLQYE